MMQQVLWTLLEVRWSSVRTSHSCSLIAIIAAMGRLEEDTGGGTGEKKLTWAAVAQKGQRKERSEGG